MEKLIEDGVYRLVDARQMANGKILCGVDFYVYRNCKGVGEIFYITKYNGEKNTMISTTEMSRGTYVGQYERVKELISKCQREYTLESDEFINLLERNEVLRYNSAL